MADELDFGSPATSTRTSSDDFTPTTLTGFADTSLDHTDSTLGGDAGPARAAGTMPHALGLGRRSGSRAGHRSSGPSPPASARLRRRHGGPSDLRGGSAGAQRFGTRATGLRGAALFVGGGCGG